MAKKPDPFLDMAQVMANGAEDYYRLQKEKNFEGFKLHKGRFPNAVYDATQEELYQTLFCLENYGQIIPYQNRCVILQTSDVNPWMRIGRPTKIELLMLILFALAKSSAMTDAAVLLSKEKQGVILGFDYGHDEKDINYITGSSLLINFPTFLTQDGILLTVQAPDRFVLLQAENKGIQKIVYYEGNFGPVEKKILSSISNKIIVQKLKTGFWHYNSLLDSNYEIPLPFRLSNFDSFSPLELAALVALIGSTRANCLKRKVGAVLIDLYESEEKGKIRSIGYNGFKSFFQSSDDCDKFFCQKRRFGGKDDRLCFSPCAEIDAFRGYYHDESIRNTYYRASLKKRNPENIWTAAVTTIEPCERCVAILFENGIFDFYPLATYDPERTVTLQKLREQKKINVRYIGNDISKK